MANRSPVDLYIYDLSNGLATMMSPFIVGCQVEGVWHTSMVAFNREVYYGGGGIITCAPGSTQLGRPFQVMRLGETSMPRNQFHDYLSNLANTTYRPDAYSLLELNCNHFCEEVAQFLCGAHVPAYILQQPEILRSLPHSGAVPALLNRLLP